MKATAEHTLLAIEIVAAIILLGFAIIASGVIPGVKITTLAGRLTLQEDIYTMDNALKAARLYARTALRYSIYQACYDNLKKGDVSQTQEEFVQALENETGKNLKIYTSQPYRFLTVYAVSLPEYTVKIEEIAPEMVKINATGDSLKIQQTSEDRTATLEADSNLSETINIACLGLWQKGKEKLQEISGALKNVIEDELAKPEWPKTLQETSDASCVDNPCEELFKTSTTKTLEEAATKIRNNIISDSRLKIEEEDVYVLSSGSVESEAEITHSCTKDPTLNKIKCDFTYNVDATLKVTITDPSLSFPVYNGTNVIFSNMTLVLLVNHKV